MSPNEINNRYFIRYKERGGSAVFAEDVSARRLFWMEGSDAYEIVSVEPV